MSDLSSKFNFKILSIQLLPNKSTPSNWVSSIINDNLYRCSNRQDVGEESVEYAQSVSSGYSLISSVASVTTFERLTSSLPGTGLAVSSIKLHNRPVDLLKWAFHYNVSSHAGALCSEARGSRDLVNQASWWDGHFASWNEVSTGILSPWEFFVRWTAQKHQALNREGAQRGIKAQHTSWCIWGFEKPSFALRDRESLLLSCDLRASQDAPAWFEESGQLIWAAILW